MKPKKQESRNCAMKMNGDEPVFWFVSYHPVNSMDSANSPETMVRHSVGKNMNKLL